ncbi:hypothetical protein SAMN04487906_1130 [Zhouia amylolytica]|uniref:DUF192 domain-containing protein n=1 Tax=Zhouia amylolytica TaxID=376730 RepID=A0A1I6RK95_9FLAO|nr:DUF192 domain-containing protein [Zhouia amylolytica]SFS65151.1 hypothetical protein SAMN04487906_1130 [Zhouia amylolytica]
MNIRRTLYIVSASFLIGGITYQCKKAEDKKIISEEITFTKEGTLQIYDNDSLLVDNIAIEIAENEYERQTGLMYRQSMQEKQAMLFIFEDEEPRSFYMRNTLISLDIIYLNRDLKIVSIIKDAKPKDETSLPSKAPAQYVLELNAGLVDQWGLKEGNHIKFTRD